MSLPQETKEQQQIYGVFRGCIYLALIIEILIHYPAQISSLDFFLNLLNKLQVFNSLTMCKTIELACIVITCLGTVGKKDLKFNPKKQIFFPIVGGFLLLGLSLFFHSTYDSSSTVHSWKILSINLYGLCSVLGIIAIHYGGDAVARYYNNQLGKDRFNFENESFPQSQQLVENEYSVNIPMIYYFKGKMNKGWINIINPFRATLVLGTPGSGKSFGIIDPFIRQHSAKGFAMMVYDYKFPTLAKTLYYQYHKNKKYNRLPKNCGFHIINFTDIEYSHRINPIQKKYIPDLAAAAETAATLLESLNKGGGGKKGGSEAFFQNSAENFLAAIIYFFINLHPTGYKNGQKLNHYISYNGQKLLLKYKNWTDYIAVDEKGNQVLNFTTEGGKSTSIDEHGMFVNLTGYTYKDLDDHEVTIERDWYETAKGEEVEPDTITGAYSDMPHVLSFLGRSYEEVFEILMQDEKIMSLMSPFASAYQNKAMDQLEGMVGTLRVNAARLVSPEAYWVFSGDDFDLKISDKRNPSYLVIANDPEKEQVIGSLNALILNRLITRINSKGNIPVSIIVDELPTLYFHKIDRLIGTARSNKVAVTLGFQELPQLEADYGKTGMQKIITTCGNIFMGAARNKETLEWAQNDVFGKAKQLSHSVSINDNKVSTSISERMDFLVPASKIADMATGWLAGQTARDFTATTQDQFRSINIEESSEFSTTKYFCKTNFDMERIKKEESKYVNLPKICIFANTTQKEIELNRNFKRINDEITQLIKELIGKTTT